MKRDLNQRPTVANIAHIASEHHEKEEEEEEEEDNTWQPSNTLTETLKTLKVFPDMKGMKKREIRDSFSNFDAWLKSEIYRVVSIDKAKEDDAVFGDLD